MKTITVYGTAWNALLDLVVDALSEDETPLAEVVMAYLKSHFAPSNTYEDVQVSVDIVNLVRDIAPATTLTAEELSYVQAECNILPGEQEEEMT